MASYPKHINHELSAMACPVGLDSVDLFGDGAQEHWYEAYEILHREAPVLRIEDGGMTPGTDAFVLTTHADVSRVVKDPERFPSLTQVRVGGYADQGVSAEETLRHVPQPDVRGDGVVAPDAGALHPAPQGAHRPLGRAGGAAPPGHDHQARRPPAR